MGNNLCSKNKGFKFKMKTDSLKNVERTGLGTWKSKAKYPWKQGLLKVIFLAFTSLAG
jgi:hypothetical protein